MAPIDGSRAQKRRPASHGTDDRLIARMLGDLIAAIGMTAFPTCLLDTMRTLAGVELCSVFLRDGSEHIELIFVHGELPARPGFPLRASHAYARTYWRSDRQLARLTHAPAGVPVVVSRRARDIADPAYRAACYDRGGVIERVSILSPGRPCLTINGYRTAGGAPFARQEVERLDLHAGLLIAALRQHLRASPTFDCALDEATLAGKLVTLEYGLSTREAEVVAALILGETQDRIAAAKQLSPTTIITYRRRAYGKLGVTSRRDLMALHRRLLAAPNHMLSVRKAGHGLGGEE